MPAESLSQQPWSQDAEWPQCLRPGREASWRTLGWKERAVPGGHHTVSNTQGQTLLLGMSSQMEKNGHHSLEQSWALSQSTHGHASPTVPTHQLPADRASDGHCHLPQFCCSLGGLKLSSYLCSWPSGPWDHLLFLKSITHKNRANVAGSRRCQKVPAFCQLPHHLRYLPPFTTVVGPLSLSRVPHTSFLLGFPVPELLGSIPSSSL